MLNVISRRRSPHQGRTSCRRALRSWSSAAPVTLALASRSDGDVDRQFLVADLGHFLAHSVIDELEVRGRQPGHGPVVPPYRGIDDNGIGTRTEIGGDC